MEGRDGLVVRPARSVRYLAGFGAGVSYGVHTCSLINTCRAIVERVIYYPDGNGGLSEPVKPFPGAFNRLFEIRNTLMVNLVTPPKVPEDQYPSLYVGRKREVYERALASLVVRGLVASDAWLNSFVKAEKVNLDAKIDPIPRIIQPRSARYNLKVGCYLKKFERELCVSFKRSFGYQVILKGLNASGVGAALRDNWSRFKTPVAIGLDASKFDQHVSVDALRFEHSVYNSAYRSPELARLLRMQIHNHGVVRVEGHRVDYQVEGRRMSGDINTGMGNCLLMSCMVLAYFAHVGLDARLANNGDDCVVICEQKHVNLLDGIDDWMLGFGFRLTREAPVLCFEKIIFCQAQPVLTGTGWRMVRDPRVAMSKDCVSLVGWHGPQAFQHWAHAIGSCGVSLTEGVPVWYQWYTRLLQMGGKGSGSIDAEISRCGMGYMARGVMGCPINDEARVSFYNAFGISPDMQVALEEEYSQPVDLDAISPMTLPDVKALDKKFNSLAAWLDTRTGNQE